MEISHELPNYLRSVIQFITKMHTTLLSPNIIFVSNCPGVKFLAKASIAGTVEDLPLPLLFFVMSVADFEIPFACFR